ncbi:UNVERIFIED_CONTAM: hypothetical protein Sindi_2149800 [Sesamum indicum]
MEGDLGRNILGLETTIETTEPIIQLTKMELQQMMEEAGRNAIVAYERRITTPIERGVTKRKLFGKREQEKIFGTSRKDLDRSKRPPSEVGSSSRDKSQGRGPAISRVEILTEIVSPNFRMPDLPKYDGARDPLEHLAAFDMVKPNNGSLIYHPKASNLMSNCCRNLPFISPQQNNETLKSFTGRFNNETLEVQDLRIDMMVSILIHGLRKGAFASALARDPPSDVEQLMNLAQKYIDEEEMNAMKDGEWKVGNDIGRDRV